ncbi:MAG TPA: hypothetical protein PLA51_08990 [Spirochaetota bacterium]|nr:hypothetical protein [Spirochaetota bacterium]
MKRSGSFLVVIFLLSFCLSEVSVMAENAGSRGSYSRAGWAGARYTAAGMTGEVLSDDVFAIYWNPAGLSELKTKKRLTETEIREKASSGNVDEITEEDLLNFSDNTYDPFFVDVGVSYTSLDIERDAGFGGVAFNFYGGVLGAGCFLITSGNIETRDENGTLIDNKERYTGTVGYLSYAFPVNIISFGLNVKSYYEAIGEYTYYGFGADAGAIVYLLPFIRMGIMIRDGVGFLSPQKEEYSEESYDFFKPEIKVAFALLTDAGVRVALSGSRKLEQDNFDYGAGVEFDLSKNLMLSAGLNDGYFSCGFTLKLFKMDISYALNFDKIDYGYNNTISLTVFF